MKTASVSETTKNVDPFASEEKSVEQRRADLERRGILRRGRGRIVKEIIETPPPSLPNNVSALALLLEVRETGR